MRLLNLRFAWPLSIFIAALGLLPASAWSATTASGTSAFSTWTCTGSPCPWGPTDGGQALVWPDTQSAVTTRLGYTVDRGVYFPAAKANGMTISLQSGSATLYAGRPDASSHRALLTLNAGGSHLVSDLPDGEVLSVQAGGAFGYTVVTPDPPPPSDPSTSSQPVTWTCTGSPCPWGSPLNGQAIVWPASANPVTQRLGYTASSGVYLPSTYANGMVLKALTGAASVYAGEPGAGSHRLLGSLSPAAGDFEVSGLAAGEVLSVQADQAFTFTATRSDPAAPGNPSDPGGTGTATGSTVVTWTCTSSPCPWGSPLSGHALVWRSDLSPQSQRLGYTTSAAAYLPAARANGAVLTVATGIASVYAGAPNGGSHRLLATLSSSTGNYQVSGLASDEVLSVQADQAFSVDYTPGDAPVPPPGGGAGTAKTSVSATWTCTSSPCPWGSTLTGLALAWPAELLPVTERLGYTTSTGVYLPAEYASGVSIKLLSGAATIYAGYPSASSHRILGQANPGQTITFGGLSNGEVISVQSPDSFTYEITVTSTPTPPSQEGVIQSVPAVWRCNTPGCTATDWQAAVITWPASTAYESNARSGDNSRTVYSHSGELLYPYMGGWAHGCQVTAVSGQVLIIEWQRGTNTWRETWVNPGQTHTINLVAPEDGAMIETFDGWAPSFSVRLANCTPQQIR